MRFHLRKDIQMTFVEQNEGKTTQSSLLLSPKTATLKDSISPFTPLLSEKGSGSSEFWSTSVLEKCRAILLDELNKGPKSLDPTVIIKLTSTLGNGEFTVQIRDCAMFVNIYKVCRAKANLIVEIHFLDGHGSKTLAELTTREMSLGQDAPDRNKISCQDTEIPGTAAMRQYWEDHTCSFEYNVDRYKTQPVVEAKPMFAVCNVILVVEDDWPLFKAVSKLEN